MRTSIRGLAALAALAGAIARDGVTQAPPARSFDAEADVAVVRAADSLELSTTQRTAFFENVDTAVQDLLQVNPAGGRPAVDSALAHVVRETGRKLRFVRHARMVFSDMFARRANDSGRPPGTEDELWRSPANVARLIELYRDNPEAGDFEMERAMAVAFKPESR